MTVQTAENSLQELLNEECVKLPIQRKDGEDYLECLRRVIHEEYLAMLKGLGSFTVREKDHYNALTEGATKLSQALITAVKTYYSGNVGAAYNLFKEALNELNSNLKEQGDGHAGLFVPVENVKKANSWYRLRLSSGEKFTERKDLFHIPMTERENVPTQRFSIAGNPSLYLGSSLFLCWKESNMPDIRGCYASRFEVGHSAAEYVFLDIRNWLSKFRKQLPQKPEDELTLFNHLCLWPLVAACSVKVRFNDKPFQPEYIIPQFLYQYASELKSKSTLSSEKKLKVLGVLYSSTTTEVWEDFDPEKEYNLAIPVIQSDHEFFSEELKSVLPLTKPISWKVVLDRHEHGEGLSDRRTSRGSSAEYYFHQLAWSFSNMEHLLANIPTGIVDGEE